MNFSIDENLMVFESNPDFSDNSRALWEYVVKHSKYKTFWVVRNEKTSFLLKQNNVDCAIFNSDEANEKIENAKFLVSSSFEFAYKKRFGQVHISLWHGFPLKLIGFFESATADIKNMNELKVITTQSDIISATSRFSQVILSGLFSVDPRKVKVLGYPRNDFLYKTNGRQELRKILKFDLSNSKLILYLPTMRKGLKNEGGQFEQNIFNYSDYDAIKMDEFLEKENAYIISKLHFTDNNCLNKENAKLSKRTILLDTDILLSELLTIYHIMNAFDVLITDYSSVFVDFLLLNKPIIFSCPDLKKYETDRGFIMDDPKLLMPGPMITCQESLQQELKSIFKGDDFYDKKRLDLVNTFHLYKDKNSSARTLKEIESFDICKSVDAGKEIAPYFHLGQSNLYEYSLQGNCKCYFDTGSGFNEKNTCHKKYYINPETNIVHLNFSLPKETSYIRFDLDYVGRWLLKDFSVHLNENKPSSFSLVVGKQMNSYMYALNERLSILIKIEDNLCSELNVEFKCFEFVKEAKNLMNVFEKEHDQLLSILNSRSWKMTSIFRK